MKFTYDQHRDIWGPLFTLQLQEWSKNVYYPLSHQPVTTQFLEWGEKPHPKSTATGGTSFSQKGISLRTLNGYPANYNTVKYFNYSALEYEMATADFKKYIVPRAFEVLKTYLHPNSRLLEIGCGPGYEAISLAEMVPDSEVIAVDFSAEMIKLAYHNAKLMQVKNITFYQADAQTLPEELHNKFDIVYCQLNCSHIANLKLLAQSLFNALYNQGFVFLVEPYATFYNNLSIPAAMASMPDFTTIYENEELLKVFTSVGFTSYYVKEIMPGIGLSIIAKEY